jgi:xanthine dehydrogenase YagT iron-sulfur-binding subunit
LSLVPRARYGFCVRALPMLVASPAACPVPYLPICGPGGVLVLVFAADWGAPERSQLELLRAELRFLGASLLVVSDGATFYFRPDDGWASRAAPAGLTPELLVQLGHAYGPRDRASSEPRELTLRLLDDQGACRLHLSQAVDDDVARTLLEALALASQSALALSTDAALSRRDLLVYSLAGALTLVLAGACKHVAKPAPRPAAVAPQPGEVPVTLDVNGQTYELKLEPRVSLLDALRERLALTGTKKGCDHGQCGACTVLVDERRVNACLTLAVMAQKKRITTIEGLARGDTLHPLQEAFVSEDALQCGYCTPGQIISALGLVRENRAISDDDVREQMSGNLCRCGAYVNIVQAIQRARKGMTP